MTIEVQCPSGHRLQLRDRFAGKRIQCPRCKATVRVPRVEEDDIFDELIAEDEAKAEQQAVKKEEKRKRAVVEKQREVERTVPGQIGSVLTLPLICGAIFGLCVTGIAGGLWLFRTPVPIAPGTEIVAAEGPDATEALAAPPATDPPTNEKSRASAPDKKVPAPSVPKEPGKYAISKVKLKKGGPGKEFYIKGTGISGYDSDTGVFVVLEKFDEPIRVYDIDDVMAGNLEPKIMEQTEVLNSLCLKRYKGKVWMVGALYNSPFVQLYDVATLAPVGDKIDLTQGDYKHVSMLTEDPDPNSPFVYYTAGAERSDENTRTSKMQDRHARFNLETRLFDELSSGPSTVYSDRRQLKVHTFSDNRQTYYEGSANRENGRLRWADGPGSPHSPTTNPFWARNVDQGKIAVGGKHHSSLTVARTQFRPLAVFRDKPLLYGKSLSPRGNLVLASSNNFAQLMSMAEPIASGTRGSWGRGAETRYIADDKRNCVIEFTGSRLYVVGLDEFDLPDTVQLGKQLALTANVPGKLIAGRETAIPLQSTPADAVWTVVPNEKKTQKALGNKRYEYKSTADPRVMPFVENRTLKWTPPLNESGTFPVRLRGTHGDQTRDIVLNLNIEIPAYDLPFWAAGVATQDNSDVALVWGQDTPPEDGKATYKIATISVATGEVLTTRDWDSPLTSGCIGPRGCYISEAPNDSGNPLRIVRLDSDTLQQKAEYPTDVPRKLKTLGDSEILASFDRKPTWRLEAGNLNLKSEGKSATSGPVAAGEGWLTDGILWDRNHEKAVLIDSPTSILNVGRFQSSTRNENSLARYLPRVTNPVFKVDRRRQSAAATSYSLRYDGTPKQSLLLFGGAAPQEQLDPTGGYVHTTNKMIAVAAGGRVSLLPRSVMNTSQEHKASILALQQPTLTLDYAKTNSFKYECNIPASFQLELSTSRATFARLQSDDGSFTWKSENEDLMIQLAATGSRQGKGKTEPERLNNYLDQITANFTKVVGRKPKGVPIAIKMKLVAIGGRGKPAELTHYAFVEVPTRDVLAYFKKQKR